MHVTYIGRFIIVLYIYISDIRYVQIELCGLIVLPQVEITHVRRSLFSLLCISRNVSGPKTYDNINVYFDPTLLPNPSVTGE